MIIAEQCHQEYRQRRARAAGGARTVRLKEIVRSGAWACPRLPFGDEEKERSLGSAGRYIGTPPLRKAWICSTQASTLATASLQRREIC